MIQKRQRESRIEQLKRYIAEDKVKITKLLGISPRMKDSICVANMERALREYEVELDELVTTSKELKR